VELDPAYAPARYFLAMCLLQTGELDTAIAELQKLVQELPEQPVAISGLAWALGVSGRRADSRRAADNLINLAARVRVPSFFVAFALAWSGNEDEVLRLLEEAYREKFSWLLYLPIDPVFDFLRNNAHFQELLRRLMAALRNQPTYS